MLHIKKLENTFQRALRNKNIHGAVMHISQGDQNWQFAGGDMQSNTNYFIASTSKLFVTAIMLQLQQVGKLRLDDRAAAYLPASVVDGLHQFKGKDYSKTITLKQLMAQTSGLPDYFEDKLPDGSSLLGNIKKGIDVGWSSMETVAISKQMPPHFKPGAKGKAHYSDTNYQLLGQIIESIQAQAIETVFNQQIIEPLGLKNTWLYTDPNDKRPIDIYYKNNKMHVPKTMASFKADGGIVSTAADSMLFIKAFFEGKLFPKELLPDLYQWNKIMFPLEYGVGVMRFKLPQFFSPFKKTAELIGHSGLSGAFAFYAPEKHCYMTGSVNQLYNPGTSFRLMLRCLDEVV